MIEAALTTVIVGVGLVATLQLLAAGTVANVDGARTTTGINLARSVRELTLKRTFAQVRAMNNQTHSPAVDSRGVAVTGMGNWTQTIKVQSVDEDGLTTDIVDSNPHAVRVTVTVAHNGEKVTELSWYRFRPMP